MSQRPKFISYGAWYDFIEAQQAAGQVDSINLKELRQRCYSEIEQLRGRPLVVYATRFVQPIQGVYTPTSIDLPDIIGFADMIKEHIGKTDSIDVLIHSPGGAPDATERIVNILRTSFKEIHFLIPHSAYSAATMLALSGNSITLHPIATLGPIDPQINGVPAKSITRGFDKVVERLKQEGPESLPAFMPLISKYSIELLEACNDSEKLSQELVSDWITKYMLADEPSSTEKDNKVTEAVKFISDYETHLTHSRPLFIEKLSSFGLKINRSDEVLSDLLYEAYILIDIFFKNSAFYKLYENNRTISWGSQVPSAQQIGPVNMPQLP